MKKSEGIAVNAKYDQYIKAALFIALVGISFFIIKPFLVPIITGIFLAYIFHPVYGWFQRIIKSKGLAAFLVSILLVILITLPLIFIVNALSQEAFTAYLTTKQTLAASQLGDLNCPEETFLCKPINYAATIFKEVNADDYFELSVQKAFTTLRERTIDFLIRLPSRFFDFFIIIFVMYYLFIDGKKISEMIWKFTLVKKQHQVQLKKVIQDVSYGVIYGSLVTAAIQGSIAGIGYWIFGITSPILWGSMTAIAALIPFVGTAIIWVPISLYQILMGLISSTPGQIGRGIGLFFYGVLAIAMIDNVLKPKIIGERGKVHPILVLVGVFGGLKLFSFIGIILGPLILALTYNIIILFHQEIAEDNR